MLSTSSVLRPTKLRILLRNYFYPTRRCNFIIALPTMGIYIFIFGHTSTAKKNENSSQSSLQRAFTSRQAASYHNTVLSSTNGNKKMRNHPTLHHDLALHCGVIFRSTLTEESIRQSHPMSSAVTHQRIAPVIFIITARRSTPLGYPSNYVILSSYHYFRKRFPKPFDSASEQRLSAKLKKKRCLLS